MNRNKCCAICCQAIGQEDGDLLAHLLGRGNKYVRRIVLESEHYIVFPSVGPLKLGHVILCPKNHYYSFACLPKNLEKEYEAIRVQLQNLLKNTFSEDVHIFEHGADAECSRIPCSVDHAHQHFIPADIDILDALRDGIEWESIRPGINNLSQVVCGREYLFYQSPNGSTILAIADKDGFESQYIRKAFAKALGKYEQWNWRTHPLAADIEATYMILSSGSANADKMNNDYVQPPIMNAV